MIPAKHDIFIRQGKGFYLKMTTALDFRNIPLYAHIREEKGVGLPLITMGVNYSYDSVAGISTIILTIPKENTRGILNSAYWSLKAEYPTTVETILEGMATFIKEATLEWQTS